MKTLFKIVAAANVLFLLAALVYGPVARAGEYDDYSWYETQKTPEPEPEPEYPPAIKKLLEQTGRPTIAEFVTAMNEAYGENGWPAENPFRSGRAPSGRDVAVLIACMERAYPGATYFGLGRDVALLGDYFDAFYRSIGQPDRVQRLDASGTSFPHYYNATQETFKADRDVLFGFLQTNGLNPNLAQMKFPFVMFDVTSWRPTSQSRQLIRAAYQTLNAEGQDLKSIFDKVNFVGIPMGGAPNEISPYVSIDKLKAQQRATITEDGPSQPLNLPSIATSLTYTDGWHEMFLSFERLSDGRVVTVPGKNQRYNHAAILGEMYNAVTMMRNPDVLTVVKQAARELGYEFPLQRTTQLELLPKNEIPKPSLFKKSESSWSSSEPSSKISSGPKSAADMRLYMNTAKKRISEAISPVSVATDLFKDLMGMLERGTATKVNLRRLIGIIRGQKFQEGSLLLNKGLLMDLAIAVRGRRSIRQALMHVLKPDEVELFKAAELKAESCSTIIMPKSLSRWLRNDD